MSPRAVQAALDVRLRRDLPSCRWPADAVRSLESSEATALLSHPGAMMEIMKPSPDADDTASEALELGDLVFGEGMLVDDEGTLIKTYAVHLGQAADLQWPHGMPVVVKGSPQRFAIEHCRTIRLSKPEVFRNLGETLISDLDEGVTRHEESSETVRVDDPADLSCAAQVNDELNRGALAIGSTRRLAVTSTKTTSRTSAKTTHTYGKNGWIWCAAVEPVNEQAWDAWLQSLGDGYDCVTTIKSPRAFARQLAMMTAHQIGPRGSTATYTHPFTRHQTEHPGVSVFHGPVAYVDDPHAYVSEATNDFERMLRAVFFKHTSYAHQREYRFVVWTAVEPEEATIDLQTTPELLTQVRTTPIGDAASADVPATRRTDHTRPTPQAQGAGEAQPDPSEETTGRAAGGPPAASDRECPPSQPIHVVVSPNDMLQSALTARFAAVIETFRQTALEEGIPADLCAAAFHLEWIVMRLLLIFVDPIESFAWIDGVFVVAFKTPDESNATAQMAVGPNGTAQYRITTDDRSEDVSCKDGFMIADTLIDDLADLGLLTCAHMVAEGHVPPQPSITQQGTERVDKRSTRSTAIRRMTTMDAPDLSEAEIDAANAEVEPRPDDARITKLVIDGGPGATSKMHGVREGLSGTYRQRTRRDQLTIRVETMNPSATVEIDPPDCAPNQEGHVAPVPDGQDTVITITATSPDGTAQSTITYIALRSDEGEQEAA